MLLEVLARQLPPGGYQHLQHCRVQLVHLPGALQQLQRFRKSFALDTPPSILQQHQLFFRKLFRHLVQQTIALALAVQRLVNLHQLEMGWQIPRIKLFGLLQAFASALRIAQPVGAGPHPEGS